MISSHKTKQNIFYQTKRKIPSYTKLGFRLPPKHQKAALNQRSPRSHRKNLIDKIQTVNRSKNSKVEEESKAKDI